MTTAESPDPAERLLAMPPPPRDPAAATAALRRHYGLDAVALHDLAGESERNWMAALPGGERLIFKILHDAGDAAKRSFQTGLLLHLERSGMAAAVPRLIRTRDGAEDCAVAAGGRAYRAVLIGVVPGEPCDFAHAGPALRRDLGRTAARLDAALASYDHPAAGRPLLWDHMRLGRLTRVAGQVPDMAVRCRLAGFVERFAGEIRPRALALPAQVIHNDLNGSNVLVAGAAITGVIDFGDAVLSPRVNEVAVAANYAMAAERDPLAALGDVLAGYDALLPLEEGEVALLPDLVAARLALRLLMYRWRAGLFPDARDEILRRAAPAERLFAHLAGLAPGVAREAMLARWTAGRGERW